MCANKETKTMTVATKITARAAVSSLAMIMALSSPALSKEQMVSSTVAEQDEFGILLRADTLVVTPLLAAGLEGGGMTALLKSPVEFRTQDNYPAFVTKAEIRIFVADQSVDAKPLTVVPVGPDGKATWTPDTDSAPALFFVYRVYGADSKFDETQPHELTLLEKQVPDDRIGETPPLVSQADEAARRTIDLPGMMVTATGRANAATDAVTVNGQSVAIDTQGRWAVQQIVPRAKAGMDIVIARNGAEVKRVTHSFAAVRNDWFVVGQGDLTLGKSYGSGPAEQVSGDSLAQGTYAIGRAAFYAKGVVGNDVRITASLDTGETLVKDLFSNFDRKDPRQLLRRLNRDQYYPVYGDDSTLVEDAPTQGRFYLRVNKADSQLVVGNFTTSVNGAELAQLDRGLFGALVDLNSKSVTSFGERKGQITAFASDPGTVPGREEFRGTGGSLYFLKRQDVSIGSERVRIEVRDRETGIVLESRELHYQEDYDFEPFQGRLVLLKPLSSTAASGGVVREGAGTGNVPVLVVRYEYTPPVGSLKGYTLGGRATGWLGDKLRFGVTAQRDTVEEANQTLIGGDAMVRLAAGTYFKSEIAQTEGPGFGQSNSVDGGLSFTDIANPGSGVKAQAWRTELAADFAEMAGKSGAMGSIKGYYEHYDRGFASAGRLSPATTARWGVAAALPFGQGWNISAKYDELTSATAGTSKTGTVDVSQTFGQVKAKLGLRMEDRVSGLLYNSVQSGSRTDAALELGYSPLDTNVAFHAFGQATLDHDTTRASNNRYGAGAKAEITKRLSLASEVSGGDGGLGADIQLNRRLGEGSEAYVGYALFADRTDTGLDSQNIFTRSDRGTLTLGTRHRFNDALSVYGENRLGMGGIAPSVSRTFGLKYEPTKEWSFTGSFENGRIDDATTGVFRRTAGSLGIGYVTEGVRVGSSVEARSEKGIARDQTVWLLRNDFSYEMNQDWRALGRFNMAVAKSDGSSVRAAEFTEAMGGFAWRPVNNERLNALVRLTYFKDLGPVGQATGSGQLESPKQVSSILSADVNYDLSKKLTLGLKYGYRSGKVSLGRNSDSFAKSDAHLAAIRADYNVVKAWDVMVEGRGLWVKAANDKRFGALGAVYRHLGNNVKVGAGYSLSKFSDDLSDQSYRSHGPFVNLLGKF
jgi:hypothetical protein